MEYLIGIALLLLSPALFAGSLLFPFYWIGQYRLLRRTGSWESQREFHDRWMGRFGKAILISYALCAGGLLYPGVFPRLNSFLWNGGLLGVIGFAAIDFVVFARWSPDRAVELWKAERAALSGPRGSGGTPGA